MNDTDIQSYRQLIFFAAGRDICLGVKWQSALNELVACKVVETHS